MKPLRDPTRRHPTAVSNSLRIIETVAVLGFGASAQEIATRLELPQATAYRLLNNLVGEEYLVRTTDLRGFGLGRRLADLIGAVSLPMFGSAARRELDALRGSVRFAVHVVVFQADALRVLDADPDHPVRAERELVRHLHASAAGKVALAARTQWTLSLPAKPTRLTPQIAPADEHERTAVARHGRSSTARSRSTSATHISGASSIIPDGVRKHLGMRGCNGPKSTPCGFASSTASDSPSGSAPKPSPYGPVRSMRSRMRSGPRRVASVFISSSASRPSTFEPRRPTALCDETGDDEIVERVDVGVRALAAEHTREPQHRAPLRNLAGLEVDQRRRVVRDVADREVVEREVVVTARQLRLGRQDHVRVTRGLVQVDVDAHHEVERRQRAAGCGRSSASTPRGCPRS